MPASTDTPSAPPTLRLLWGAIAAGPLLATAALWAVRGEPSAPDLAEVAFYALAAASLAGTAVALVLIRRMEARLLDASDRPAALQTVQTYGIAALAAAELPAMAAPVVGFVTGEWLGLAFLVPFLGLVALTWPTAARVARWTALGERP